MEGALCPPLHIVKQLAGLNFPYTLLSRPSLVVTIHVIEGVQKASRCYVTQQDVYMRARDDRPRSDSWLPPTSFDTSLSYCYR